MRTYHSIPSLQRDEFSKKNLQDAPRYKSQLKSCVLPSEAGQAAGSLPEITKRSVRLVLWLTRAPLTSTVQAQGFRPPTSAINLIFELFSVDAVSLLALCCRVSP